MMKDDRCTIKIPRDACATIIDSIQRAIVDKGASKATRKAAFSALLALLDAGLIVDETSTSAAGNEAGAAQRRVASRPFLAG